jgi:uncharacterized protein YggE
LRRCFPPPHFKEPIMNPRHLVPCLIVGLMLGTSAAFAQTPPTPWEQRLLTVSGEASVKAVPDMAQLSAGVIRDAPTAAAALADNARAMNAVLASLKQAGVPEKAIQTSNFSVSPQYQQYKPGTSGPPRIIGYQISNTVNVTVGDLRKAGPTLDALVASGANRIGEVSFAIGDPKPLLRAARAAAVKDAIDRAQTYASAAGLTLGPIVSIQEGGSEAPTFAMAAPVMLAKSMDETPILAGEQSVSASVSISWEIH